MFSKMFGRKESKSNGAACPPAASEAAKSEAKANPGGWVYEIAGGYNNTESVPPQAIKGAWRVDDEGEITDEFKANPNFDPMFRKPAH